MNKTKQITFLSAIVILVSGTIGSGIFFKNSSLASLGHGNLSLVISAWIVAAAGIMALGVGIAEMSLRSHGKKGVLEWTRTFMPTKLHYTSKNFVQLIFTPILLFALPIYEVKALNQAGLNLSTFAEVAVGFAIFAWFAIMSFVSTKAGEVTQWIVMVVKFIPLVVLPIWAMTQTGSTEILHKTYKETKGLAGVGGGFMILVAGLSAIAFSFDGFYSVTTLKSKMVEPKKMAAVIAVGLAVVTAFYLFVTIGFGLGTSDGTHKTILNMNSQTLKAFSALIAVGIIGVVNGYAQFGTNTYISLHEDDQSWYTRGWEKVINRSGELSKRTVAFIAYFSTVSVMFVVFSLIGIFAWDGGSPKNYYGHQGVSNLIGFVDTLTNYKSLLIFLIISTALVFALPVIRKDISSNKKRFVITLLSIIGIATIYVSGIFTLLTSIVDMTGYNGASQKVAIVKFSILICVALISTVAGLLEYKSDKKNKKIISKGI